LLIVNISPSRLNAGPLVALYQFLCKLYHLLHHSIVTPPHRSISYIKGYHLELLLMNRNLEDIKNRVKPILQKYGIKKAGIFGSAARGAVMPNDIDILVKIDRKISLLEFISIQQEIEDELGIKVDLVEYSAIKPALKDDILDEEVSVI